MKKKSNAKVIGNLLWNKLVLNYFCHKYSCREDEVKKLEFAKWVDVSVNLCASPINKDQVLQNVVSNSGAPKGG